MLSTMCDWTGEGSLFAHCAFVFPFIFSEEGFYCAFAARAFVLVGRVPESGWTPAKAVVQTAPAIPGTECGCRAVVTKAGPRGCGAVTATILHCGQVVACRTFPVELLAATVPVSAQLVSSARAAPSASNAMINEADICLSL